MLKSCQILDMQQHLIIGRQYNESQVYILVVHQHYHTIKMPSYVIASILIHQSSILQVLLKNLFSLSICIIVRGLGNFFIWMFGPRQVEVDVDVYLYLYLEPEPSEIWLYLCFADILCNVEWCIRQQTAGCSLLLSYPTTFLIIQHKHHSIILISTLKY